jgi:hypothetical protein
MKIGKDKKTVVAYFKVAYEHPPAIWKYNEISQKSSCLTDEI